LSSALGPEATFGALTLMIATSKKAEAINKKGIKSITRFITGTRFGSSTSSDIFLRATP
jgi:hypothetical protein